MDVFCQVNNLLFIFQYIHTKGAFWPGNVFINQERLNIPTNVSVEVKFQPFVNEKLNDDQCIEVPNYNHDNDNDNDNDICI